MTQTDLKKVLHYDPITGVFTWRVNRGGKAMAGTVAGCTDHQGYRAIKVGNKTYMGHRLAWLYVHGYFPENGIDHINRDSTDNRIINLREVSQQCNMRNTGNHRTNTSGVKGVSWDKKDKRWKAYVIVERKFQSLGNHLDFDEAVCHRLAAEQALDWHGCDTDSPAYTYVRKNIQCL